MTQLFDCLIFGAGPAGSSAALSLAQQGLKVLAIDRDDQPTLACAGGVSPGIAKLLDLDFQPIIECRVQDVQYTWKHRDPVSISLDHIEPMWMVRRDRFDPFLRQKAIDAGATLMIATATGATLQPFASFLQTRLPSSPESSPESSSAIVNPPEQVWRVTTDQGEQWARYVIVADGATSQAIDWVGLSAPDTRSAAVLDVAANPGDPLRVEFALGQIKNGFIWCFPKQNAFSIGAATFIGTEDTQLVSRLLEFAQHHGWQADRQAVRERSITLWNGDRVLHTSHALVIGDAAGLADPVTAEGIRPAIDSGLKAATAIAAALAGNPGAIATYTDTIQATWGADMVWAARLAKVLYRFPGIVYKVAVKNPKASQLMAKVLCGEMRYSDIAEKAISKLGGSLLPWG